MLTRRALFLLMFHPGAKNAVVRSPASPPMTAPVNGWSSSSNPMRIEVATPNHVPHSPP